MNSQTGFKSHFDLFLPQTKFQHNALLDPKQKPKFKMDLLTIHSSIQRLKLWMNVWNNLGQIELCRVRSHTRRELVNLIVVFFIRPVTSSFLCRRREDYFIYFPINLAFTKIVPLECHITDGKYLKSVILSVKNRLSRAWYSKKKNRLSEKYREWMTLYWMYFHQTASMSPF